MKYTDIISYITFNLNITVQSPFVNGIFTVESYSTTVMVSIFSTKFVAINF